MGAGQGGDHIARDLLTNPQRHQEPVGFVDDDPLKRRRRIHNLPVLGSVDGLVDLVTLERIDIIGIAIPSASAAELERILRLAQETNARIQVLPPTGEMTESETPLQFRDINLNDLLIRSPSTNLASAGILSVTIKGQVILVTGAAGSIGSELCRQLATFELKMLIAVDNNESGLFDLGKDLAKVCDPARFILVLGDVTDVNKLASIFNKFRPSMVFHAAAFKHVPRLEDFPEEALSVNVQGTLNMCQLAAESGCARFVFVSTDKAVHPVNALGYSKRLGELVARVHDGFGCVFCSVRFGNVVGSRGSALPEFVRQIDAGGPVRVTHPDVERYFMTIAEAANLVIEAGTIAKGGEIFMLDMGDPVKIAELAKRIIRMRGLRVGPDIEIVFTGLRPGEKLTEDLLFQGERIRPTQNPSIVAVDEHSRTDMDKDQLQAQVDELHLIAANGDPDALRAALRQAANGASQSAPTGS